MVERIVTKVLAWLSAFLIVVALFTLFGDWLGAQSLLLRALIISGVMVVLMLNVVMPGLRRAIGRWLAPAWRPRPQTDSVERGDLPQLGHDQDSLTLMPGESPSRAAPFK
jgi:antibiotic biosynthesis monooxygenase (ABM) superfamily enzyme